MLAAGDRATAADPPASLTDLPLAAQATVAGVLARADEAFLARTTGPGVVELRNAEHDLMAEVTGHGVTMSHAGLSWRLDLQRWGRGAELTQIGVGRVNATQNRVDVTRAALVEWYVNGRLGIEQGFTLGASPSVADGRPVVLELATSGAARLAIADDRASLEVLGPDGAPRLRYAGLTALDADGRALPVAMHTADGVLRLEVDDRGARYPVVVDPLVQTAKFRAAKPRDFLTYGQSVAISGDTLVVGVPGEPIHTTPPYINGAVHVFVRTGATWSGVTEVAVLRAVVGFQALGMSVAIDGDTIVAGDPFATSDGPGAQSGGAALVFVRPPGGWSDVPPVAGLWASDGGGLFLNYDFGYSVAIDGDTIVAGGYLFGPNDYGAAYVYEKPPGGWVTASETGKLTAAVPIFGERLGESVAISGDVIVVGAAGYPSSTGSALIYERPIGGWVSMTETAAIGASDGQIGDAFGVSVAIDGDTIAVGACRRDAGIVEDAGGVYVFEKPIGGWMSETETALLLPSSVQETALVGRSMAIAGDRIITGANGFDHESSYAVGGGGVYVFEKPLGGWAPVPETALLLASDAEYGGNFGQSVGLSTDGAIAVSTSSPEAYPYEQVGAAYVFEEIANAVECPATPSVGCAQAGKGQVTLKYNTEKRGGSQLKWKFALGPELHRSDFGDPLTTTSYALCVYDDGELRIARPLLGGFGRWALSGTDAYAYANKAKSYVVGGVGKAKLKGGVAGKSLMQIQGKGPDLGALPWQAFNVMLNATTSVQIQLVQGGGGCYETSFLPANVSANSYEYIDGTAYGFKGTFQAGY
jgi:hypothetical protein